jgi:large subunit ribosomal protein L5
MAKTKGKKDEHGGAPVDTGPALPPRLRERYKSEVAAKFAEQFGLKNRMAQPRLEKIVLNVNLGRFLEGNKIPALKKDTTVETLRKITGQKPVITYAKKSVSNFKVREGAETAYMVTIRRDRMWHFLDRLINLAIPRIKDFRGMPATFDRNGNYSMGLAEQGVFPEINMAEVDFTHGMNINMVFSNSSPAKSRFVLEALGFPFRKETGGSKKKGS